MSDTALLFELTQLRERLAALETAGRKRPRKASWRLRATLVGLTTVGLVGALAGIAGASGTATTAVAFTPISPQYKVVAAGSIAAGKTASYTVAGLPTTAPDNATTVQLIVQVKGTKAGTLGFYPAGNPSGGSGQTLSWAAAGVGVGTIAENVGTKNQLTVSNSSLATATVAITLIGYSTQVTAGDINGSGGATGQVLTNTGAGASWQTVGHSYAEPTAFQAIPLNGTSYVPVATVAVPTGSYVVSFTGTLRAFTGGLDNLECNINGPTGQLIGFAFGSASSSAPQNSVAIQGQLHTSAGTITASCFDITGAGTMSSPSLIATAVGAQSGAVTS